jgi:hypothetical protein
MRDCATIVMGIVIVALGIAWGRALDKKAEQVAQQ